MQRKEFSFIKWVLVLVFLNSCKCLASHCSNCCNSYKEINEPRRSLKSRWKVGQTPLCDRRILKGWYRFTSFNGTKMPEESVESYHCGTHSPVWLKDQHPTEINENVARTACISNFGNTCRYSITINVTKCPGDYFVYFLKPTSFCASAYCAGFGEPCPYGKEGKYPYTRCYDPPALFSRDNLGLPEITYVPLSKDNSNDFYAEDEVPVTLVCKVALLNGIEKWGNVSYLIEWFADGKSLKNETRCGVRPGSAHKLPCPPNQAQIDFKLLGLEYKIGHMISCQVSAMFTTSPKNKWSSPKQVPEPFFAGLKANLLCSLHLCS